MQMQGERIILKRAGAASVPRFAARPVFTLYPPRCSRRSRLKFLPKLFSKKPEAAACKIRVQPRGACHGFCLGRAERPGRYLAACGPRFYEGCGLGKRALPSKKGKTHEGLAFFLTRRLFQKAGENF